MSKPPGDFDVDGGSAGASGSAPNPAAANVTKARVAIAFLMGGTSRMKTAVRFDAILQPGGKRSSRLASVLEQPLGVQSGARVVASGQGPSPTPPGRGRSRAAPGARWGC